MLIIIISLLLGACIGSFLNVCIYRLPLGLSVNNPKRSFCPSCKTQIPWFHNIPIISYILLRGKCFCPERKNIGPRYFAVEILSALLFGYATWALGPSKAINACIFISLLIVATFVDLQYYIIPDEVSLGGIGAGLILSAIFPALLTQNNSSHLTGLIHSAEGAAVGYFGMWGIVELGKLAFGKKKITFDKDTKFKIKPGSKEDYSLYILDVEEELKENPLWEENTWEEIFSREKDRLILQTSLGEITCSHNKIWLPNKKEQDLKIIEENEVYGWITTAVVPREAMGFGDVKLMGCIGAFLGVSGTAGSLFSGSLVATILYCILIAIGKKEKGEKIPFGPYLAIGALAWMLGLKEVVLNYIWNV